MRRSLNYKKLPRHVICTNDAGILRYGQGSGESFTMLPMSPLQISTGLTNCEKGITRRPKKNDGYYFPQKNGFCLWDVGAHVAR